MAAFLSFLCPGLGQLIQGRVLAGLIWFVAVCISGLLCFVAVGFVTTPILWIWCVVNAAKYDRRLEDKRFDKLARAVRTSQSNPFN